MIHIRRLGPADAEALRTIRLRALADAPGSFFRGLAEEEAQPLEYWRELLERENRAIFGLFEGAALIGLTAVFTERGDPTTATLGMTWLDPAYRGRGLSRLYFEARVAWARATGHARIAVSHRRSNEASRRAVLAAGFRAIGTGPIRWPDGSDEDEVMYELILERDK